MLATNYTYDGITDENYSDAEKYHIVKREDSFKYIGLRKEDYTQGTLVNIFVCFGDPTIINQNWFLLSKDFNTYSNDTGDGELLSGVPLNGVTGIMVQPLDADTSFSLSVLEFFPPNKIRTITPSEQVVT